MEELRAAYENRYFSQRPFPTLLQLSLALESLGDIEAPVDSPILLDGIQSKLQCANAFANQVPKIHDALMKQLASKDSKTRTRGHQRLQVKPPWD
jgi:hypothetical protein